MTMRTAISGRPISVALMAAVPIVAFFLVGVRSRAGEPVRKTEKTVTAWDRLEQASALVERLNERVKAQRAALQEAEADLKLARELVEGLTSPVAEEWKAARQREYEGQERRHPKRGDQADPGEPAFRIIPLAR